MSKKVKFTDSKHKRFLQEVWRTFKRVGFNEVALAEAYKRPRTTVQGWIRGIERVLGHVKPETKALHEKHQPKTEHVIIKLKRALRDSLRQNAQQEDVRQSVFKLGRAQLDPPKWMSERVKAKPGTPGVPVLFTSDFQWGEMVSKREMGGVNEFNRSIASRRYKRMIDTTIDLCFNHMVNPKYPFMVYLRGGDMISGEIHEDLAETNDLHANEAVIDLVNHEIAGLQKLLDAGIPKIVCITTVGNHGRATLKARSKRVIRTSFDYVSALMIENWFRARGETRIEFRHAQQPDYVFRVFGYTFCMTHGDRIGSRGGMGHIGPAATIMRGMKRVVEYYAGLGQVIDYVLVAHFHTAMELELGFSNGSLPGISEYARDFRALVKPPEQWLFFVHPKHGVTARWKVLLEDRPVIELQKPELSALG